MIRQKFWKELRSHLCPRQNWHLDEQSLKCECCRLPFHFFRRKHHCRFCGKIFCFSCSDLYINGTYLGLSEKYVRFCQFCREDIQKIKQDLNRLTYMIDQDEELVRQPEEEDVNSDDDEESFFFSIKHIFGSVEKDEMEKIVEYLQSESKSICKKIYKKHLEVGSISHDFQSSKLLQTVNRVLCDCKMNILPQQFNTVDNYMDVSQHIEIKTLQGEPGEIIQVVEGMVLEKNISIKGMQSNFISPQVIVIENTLDQALLKVKFQEMIASNTAIYELIEQKIMRMNPDIIFVEKSVSKDLLKFFCENKICVINGLTKGEMSKIAHISCAKTIKNVLTVGRENGRFIGSLGSMKIVAKLPLNNSLIYLQKQSGNYTLLISERDEERQELLKRSLKKLMRMIRQVHLQKFLIYVDSEMTLDHSPNTTTITKLNPMYRQMTQKLKYFNLVFYKIVLKEIKQADLDKNQKDYCKMLDRQYMLDICSQGTWQQFQPYSELDSTIGSFLLTMATNLMKKCQTCKLTHRKRLYFRDRGVEITASYIQKQEEELEKNYLNQKDLTIQHMHSYLKRYKEDSHIFSYFKCQKCGKIINKKSKIGKNYLKNSFHYFMMLLSSATPPDDKSSSEDKSRPSMLDLKECRHLQSHRYIQTFNMEFKLKVFSLTTYSLDRIDLQDPSARSLIDQNIVRFIQQMTKKTLVTRNNYLLVINNWLISYLGYLQQYKLNNSPDIKILQLFQKIKKVHRIIQRIGNYMLEMNERESSKEVTNNTDWTIFNRQIAKIDYVLKTAIYILIYIQGKLSKKKVVKQEEIQNLQKLVDDQDFNDAKSLDNLFAELIAEKMVYKKSNDFLQVPERVREETISSELKNQKENFRDASDDTESRYWRRMSNSSGGTFAQIESNMVLKNFLQEMKKRRYQIKKGQLFYFNYLNLKDHISILAYALNSSQFAEQLQKPSTKSSDSIKFNIVVSKSISTNWEIKKQIDELRYEQPQDDEAIRQSYEIVAHYHQEFQELRTAEGISYDMYVRSITSAEQWEGISGGKSNSYFAKSNDSLLVIKTIKDTQFSEFTKFAWGYINHMKLARKSGRNPILTKIYGIYELSVKGHSHKCIVMQNLFFKLDFLKVKVYDLKGSETNRTEVPKSMETKFTGLDTNFKIDKNYQPYIMDEHLHKEVYESLQEDILFLSKNQVIDYSLLVIESEKTLRLGVIDFMRPYHFKEMLEKKYKEIKSGREPTVLPPNQYASRFMMAFKRYFMPKVSDIAHN